MSDDIPFHIQEEIMKRLPVKSLVEFRCVSKAWKSLIDSSEFIFAHTLLRHNQPLCLLVSYEHSSQQDMYVHFSRCYIDDDDTFLQQRSVLTLPQSVKQLLRPTIVGTTQGLLCLYGYHPIFSTNMAVLWNPSIRKSIVVHVPGEPSFCHSTGYPFDPSVGFGVCPVTNDPKILATTQSSEVLVYTLSSRRWRSVSTNLPTGRTGGLLCSVVTNRFIYWDVQLQDLKMIMSFDLTSESFEVIDLPDSLARHNHWALRISKLKDSLVFLQYDNDYKFSTVWMMGHGTQKSFTKLFTITTPPHCSTVGFRKNGISIMAVTDDDGDIESNYKLVVYEPNLEQNNVLEICDAYYYFYVHSYMETLLLLGRSDYTRY